MIEGINNKRLKYVFTFPLFGGRLSYLEPSFAMEQGNMCLCATSSRISLSVYVILP